MRRTPLTVLVPAVFYALTAFTAPASAAQPAHHRPTHHSRPAPAPRETRTHVSRRTASNPCQASYRAGYRAGKATKSASSTHLETSRSAAHSSAHTRHGSTSLAVAEKRHRRPDAAPAIPAPESRTQARALRPRPATPDEPAAKPVAFYWNRHIMPPPMRGSLASLERQNDRADAEGLERIEDEADLSDRIARGALVPVPVSSALSINADLPEHHRYCRPWTARFLSDLSHAFDAQFHAPLEVSSAVRTVEYQKRLMRVNGNAAPAEGDIASPHLTGATIDIAKKSMTRQQIGWMRYYLGRLQTAGKIDVEEEFQQACFHISVYKNYVASRPPSSVARTRSGQPRPTQTTGRDSSPDLPGGTIASGR